MHKRTTHYLHRSFLWIFFRKYDWPQILAITLFGILALVMYEPWTLSNWQQLHKAELWTGFGCIFLLVYCGLNSLFLFFRRHSLQPNRRFLCWRLLAFTLFMVILGTINWVYALVTIPFVETSFYWWGRMLLRTLEYSFIPLLLLILLRMLRNSLEKWSQAEERIELLNCKPPMELEAPIPEWHGNRLNPNEILYCRVMQNYIYVFSYSNGKVLRKNFRCTIKQMSELMQMYPYIVRCHNSYLVNTQFIEKTCGNSAKMSLTLSYIKESIPVSRKYMKEFS